VELEHILDMLQDMSPDQRAAVPGLNPARADIIVAGFAVAAEVLARLGIAGADRLGVWHSRRLAARDSTRRPDVLDRGEARERSVREFAERCHYEERIARRNACRFS
jgi:exopolyphosphatase/guanosine-5'-triphosphate,3'-diphosphate pyrophosphatase